LSLLTKSNEGRKGGFQKTTAGEIRPSPRTEAEQVLRIEPEKKGEQRNGAKLAGIKREPKTRRMRKREINPSGNAPLEKGGGKGGRSAMTCSFVLRGAASATKNDPRWGEKNQVERRWGKDFGA